MKSPGGERPPGRRSLLRLAGQSDRRRVRLLRGSHDALRVNDLHEEAVTLLRMVIGPGEAGGAASTAR